jgi:hypothetical protein
LVERKEADVEDQIPGLVHQEKAWPQETQTIYDGWLNHSYQQAGKGDNNVDLYINVSPHQHTQLQIVYLALGERVPP